MINLQRGDTVTPVRDNWNIIYGTPTPGPRPRVGDIYTVAKIHLHSVTQKVALTLAEMPANCYEASAFRKVPPLDFDFRKLKQKEPA